MWVTPEAGGPTVSIRFRVNVKPQTLANPCIASGVWVTPEAGGPTVWHETGEGRAPLVASVLEQFGRMTALARETTSNLLTSTWGVQPGVPKHKHGLKQC